MIIPKLFEATIADNSPLKDELALLPADDVVLDSTNVDAGATPTYWFRAGGLVVYKTSAKTFVEADDATGDRDTVASATSIADIGAGAANKTFKWTYKSGGVRTVTGVTATTSAAAWVTLLNANTDFSPDLVASASGSKLVVKAKRAGYAEQFQITDGTLNAQAGVANDTFVNNTDFAGTYAVYRVTLADAVLQDKNGVAVAATARSCRAGHFVTARLRNRTGEALAALTRAGSFFD